jgi:hypothetical protein
MAAGHRAPAGHETWRPNLHCSEHGQQSPCADVLERPLRPAMGAKPPLTAIFLCLCADELVLQSRERPFAVRQRQPNRPGRALGGAAAAARADFALSDRAVAPGQFNHDPPLHPVPPGRLSPARPYHPPGLRRSRSGMGKRKMRGRASPVSTRSCIISGRAG